MPDDLVIFVKCNTSAEKRAFVSVAKARGKTLKRFALEAMAELPPRQREVLYLGACEGMPTAEIGEVLGVSADAVKANLSLARKRMRVRLHDLVPDSAQLE